MPNEISSIPVLKFWIPGKVVPKARPRVTKNGTYFPKRYQQWRFYAQKIVLLQVPKDYSLPVKKAEMQVLLFKQKKGDGDNIFGSCGDLLVESGILLDDRINCLPKHSFEAVEGKELGVQITIIPLN